MTSLKPLKEKKQAPGTWTQNATQPSPDTPKTATSRRSTQNSQTPPKSGRKPSKKPSPAAWQSDKSETPKGEETGPSTWTQNATQPRTRNSQTPLLLHEHTHANLRVAYALLFASPSKRARGRRIYINAVKPSAFGHVRGDFWLYCGVFRRCDLIINAIGLALLSGRQVAKRQTARKDSSLALGAII